MFDFLTRHIQEDLDDLAKLTEERKRDVEKLKIENAAMRGHIAALNGVLAVFVASALSEKSKQDLLFALKRRFGSGLAGLNPPPYFNASQQQAYKDECGAVMQGMIGQLENLLAKE